MKFNKLIDILEREFACASNACTDEEYIQIFGRNDPRYQAITYAQEVLGLNSQSTTVMACADQAGRDIRSIVFLNIVRHRLKQLEVIESALESLVFGSSLRPKNKRRRPLLRRGKVPEYQELTEAIGRYLAITQEHEAEVSRRFEALTSSHRK